MTNVTTMKGLIDDYGFTRDEARKYVDMPKRLLLREIRDLLTAVANLDEGDAAELAKVRGEIAHLSERHSQDEARIARIVALNATYSAETKKFAIVNDELWRDKSKLQAELETTRAKNAELSIQHECDQYTINRETVRNVLKVYAALEGKDAAIKILKDNGTDSISKLDEDKFEDVIKIIHKKAHNGEMSDRRVHDLAKLKYAKGQNRALTRQVRILRTVVQDMPKGAKSLTLAMSEVFHEEELKGIPLCDVFNEKYDLLEENSE